MNKKQALEIGRRLALATVRPGFDPREIEADVSALSEGGWEFANCGRCTCSLVNSSQEGWVIKTPKKGRRKTVAYDIVDYALFEQGGALVSAVSSAKTRKEVDSLTREFGGILKKISAASLVTELEEGMAHAVESADLPEFDAVEFAESNGLSYRHTGLNEWIYGDTKPHRQELKDNGFKWAAKKKQWYRKAA